VKGGKMNTNTNRGQDLILEAMAYALAGIFLLTVTSNLILCIAGWVLIAFATFLIVESFLKRPISWGNKIGTLLSGTLFVATVADFIIESVRSEQAPYIVLAVIFVLLLLSALVFQTFKIFKKS
jgi:uncharacterized membrane protein HdeD (DUF308 family)